MKEAVEQSMSLGLFLMVAVFVERTAESAFEENVTIKDSGQKGRRVSTCQDILCLSSKARSICQNKLLFSRLCGIGLVLEK